MKKSIRADITVYNGSDLGTARYLKEKWGMTLRGFEDGAIKLPGKDPVFNRVEIEFRDYPSIMLKVEKAGYFSKHEGWFIHQISDAGISFYVDSYSGMAEDGEHTLWQQGLILVPMTNVNAIHDISEQFFIDLSVKSLEGKVA